MTTPPNDLPADVRAVLSQVFEAVPTELGRGETTAALSLVETARTVTTNKVPPGDRRQLLLSGCDRLETVVAGTGNHEDRVALAGAYCDSLSRLVGDTD